MDIITFKLNKDYNDVTIDAMVTLNGENTKIRFNPLDIKELKDIFGIDTIKNVSDLIAQGIQQLSSTLTKSEIETQVTSEMKQFNI